MEKEPNAIVTESLGISENGASEATPIMLEYIDNSTQLSHTNDWTLHIKTLTGNVIDVVTANPQVLYYIYIYIIYLCILYSRY